MGRFGKAIMTTRSGEGFGRFYRENLHALRGYIARLLPNTNDSEDLANEAFTRVLAASTPERPVPPRAYLYSAAHNLAMNHHRRQRVRGHPIDPDLGNEVPDPSPGADRELIGRERVDLLWRAVAQLPPRCREVFLLRKIEHLSNAAIADQLGISVSAVEKHIRLGLMSCRNYLESFEGEGETNPDCAQVSEERADDE